MDLHKTKKLLEINKILTQSLQLDEILHNVIVSARELVEVSDVFLIYLYDEASNTLQFAEGKGVDKEKLSKIAFDPGESISGKVFSDKKSKLFTSEKEIDAYMKNMSEANYAAYYDGVKRRKVKSAFCVPILIKNRCLGVVVVDNFNKNGVFTEEDLEVIEAIADQSAIAIDNSNVYQNLKEKNNLLKQSISIHNQFYRLIIDGRGIEHFISLLERIISSPITFSTEKYPEGEDNIFPIARGSDVLGHLKLTKSFDRFSEMEQIAIEQASLSIALELIKNNALFEKEIHFREEVFNQLMEGISGRDLQHALHYVKWNEKTDVQCIILEGKENPLWEVERLIDKERFIQSLERITKTMGINSLIFTRAFQLIIIIPKLRTSNVNELINEIQLFFGKNHNILFGIGRETKIQDLSISYNEAVRSIGYAKMHDIQIVEYAMLGIERLLYEVDEEVLDMFMKDKLHSLDLLDESYIKTIQLFIKLNKNSKKTAEKLHIHANTLYYRLRKIESVLEINFDNEKDWIDLVIAFRLYMASNKRRA